MSRHKKLADMILVMASDRPIGRTALNKLLFFADAAFFLTKKKTISGAEYVKLDYGPVPKNIDRVRGELLTGGHAEKKVIQNGPYVQHSYQASNKSSKEAENSFSAEEMAILRAVQKSLGKCSAVWLSEKSHEFEPWKTAEWYDTLDFNRITSDRALEKFLKDYGVLS